MRRLSVALLVLAAAPLGAPLGAQQSYPSQWSPAIAQRADVKAALATIEKNFPAQVEEWIRIAEMPAKSEHEQQRGAYVKAQFEAMGLPATVDSIGNVEARRPGAPGGPVIVFAAHMDIVHPMDTDLKVRRAGDTLRAPGIFDNSASVANLLAAARAMQSAKVKTKATLVFLATTQEEVGFNGMAYWLKHHPKPAMLVGMDGGLSAIRYGALGIYWTRYVFTSAGSHTVTSRGKPTPVKALADAVQHIYQLTPPPLPTGAVYNIGQVHGGTIFNGIPQELSFTMDLRSADATLLDSLDRAIETAVADAAAREKVQWRKEIVTRNRAGGTEAQLAGARAHPIVQTAVDIQKSLGVRFSETGQADGQETEATGTTDANIGVVNGIPSIAIGRSYGGNQHTLSEWADAKSALPATKMVLLLAVSLSDGTPTRGIVP